MQAERFERGGGEGWSGETAGEEKGRLSCLSHYARWLKSKILFSLGFGTDLNSMPSKKNCIELDTSVILKRGKFRQLNCDSTAALSPRKSL